MEILLVTIITLVISVIMGYAFILHMKEIEAINEHTIEYKRRVRGILYNVYTSDKSVKLQNIVAILVDTVGDMTVITVYTTHTANLIGLKGTLARKAEAALKYGLKTEKLKLVYRDYNYSLLFKEIPATNLDSMNKRQIVLATEQFISIQHNKIKNSKNHKNESV